MVNSRYLEIIEHTSEGFKPCIDYGEWRVAILRYISDVDVKNIKSLERHLETDEVFVLLEGNCTLLIGEGREIVSSIHKIEMSPLKLYNVKKGTYHNHILSKDARVLIVENRNTSERNSEIIPLSVEQQHQIRSIAG